MIYVLLHSAIGDSVVAFRHIIKLSEDNPNKTIILLYNDFIDEFMHYWSWPTNIKLKPLKQIFHDINNESKFPYYCEEKEIIDNIDNIRDYRPFFIHHHNISIGENNLQRLTPELTRPPLGSEDYIVLQPISTDHTHRYESHELDTYQNFLLEIITYITLKGKNIVMVGTQQDAHRLPRIASKQSSGSFFNLIGLTTVTDYCALIQHSSGLWGQNSSGTNISSYIFDKPTVSWTLWNKGCDFFANFIDRNNNLINNECRPWLKGLDYYEKFFENERKH